MRYAHLHSLLPIFAKERKIQEIRRIENNSFLVVFDSSSYIFDLSPSNQLIYEVKNRTTYREFTAPFDITLAKVANNSQLISINLLNLDKILELKIEKSSSYKRAVFYLIFEFTNRQTNVIILDENRVIVESLKKLKNAHREIVLQEIYRLPPPLPREPEIFTIPDILEELAEKSKRRAEKELSDKKQTELARVEAKKANLIKIKESLQSKTELENEAKKAQKDADLLLANLHLIRAYSKEVELTDYDGSEVVIKLQNKPTPQQEANYLYAQSKRLKAKASGVAQEEENIATRIVFFERLSELVSGAKSPKELNEILPQKPNKKEKELVATNIEVFEIDGYRILLGKNEKANAKLLKEAKASDIWMHLKDMPSAHLIIKTAKQNPPEALLYKSAKLVASFSLSTKGRCVVDFTARRNVKVVKNAQVTYTNYKSLELVI